MMKRSVLHIDSIRTASARGAELARAAIAVGALATALHGALAPAQGQDLDVLVFSTEPGGGALVPAEFDFGGEIRVRDRLGFCPGGQCFYSTTDPGFRTPSGNRPAEGLYALAPGTSISFHVVALDPGASIKWGATVLDGVGESTRIGESPLLHEHPEYQLQVAEGVTGRFRISFRLSTTSQQYDDSQVYVLTLANSDSPATPVDVATPTPSPTSTEPPKPTATHTELPTATQIPTATVPPNDTCDGDCAGDGVVSIADLIRGVNIALSRTPIDDCPVFDINRDGTVSVGELISAVRDALDGC